MWKLPAHWFTPPSWLRRWVLGYRYRQIAVQAHAVSIHKPDRKLCAQLLMLLEPQQFEHYRAAMGQATTVSVLYAPIERYTQRLRETAAQVQQGKPIEAGWIAFEETTISIDRFLVSADGYYMLPAAAVANFKGAATRLCQLLEPADSETAGLYEHNLRVLTRLFVNLRVLTLALLEVSVSN